MNDKVKSFNLVGIIKFSVTTLFFIDFIRRVFESALVFNSLAMIISIALISLLALVGLKNEFHNVQLHNKSLKSLFDQSKLINIIITFGFASFATYLGANFLSINVSLAASIVVLSMILLIPEPFDSFQGAVYTGTFTGMVNNQFISSWVLALLLGLVGSLFFIFFQPSYRETGGRAGLNAYMSSFVLIYLFSDVNTSVGAPLEKEMIIPSFLFLIIGSFTAYLLKEKTFLTGIEAAMLVTLMINLLVPNKWPALINAGFTGSFMGTSASNRIKSLSFLFLVEIFVFLLFVPAYPLLAGIAGKLGTVTLISYLAADGTISLIESHNE